MAVQLVSILFLAALHGTPHGSTYQKVSTHHDIFNIVTHILPNA